MSGTFPISIGTSSAKIRSKVYNLMSESVSGRIQVRTIGGQRWELTLSFPPLTRAEFAPVQAFVMRQAGMAETFTVVVPELSQASASASGSVTASATAAIGATSVTLTGLTGTLTTGDFVKFASHTKVYQITADRSGNGAVSIYPALQASVPSGNAITYNSVPFTVRLSDDIQEFSVGVDMLFAYEIDLIEAI